MSVYEQLTDSLERFRSNTLKAVETEISEKIVSYLTANAADLMQAGVTPDEHANLLATARSQAIFDFTVPCKVTTNPDGSQVIHLDLNDKETTL